MRTIDSDAMKAEVESLDAESNNRIYQCAMEDMLEFFIELIDKQPTIEPEVRHGRMIEGRYPNENKCSECGQVFRDDIGFIIQDDGGIFHYPKRCPECGCYWDGGAENV